MGTFGCFEVTIGWYGKERCDFITYDTKSIWKCYEIKTSVEDFHSKAAHTFCGHYNYFVMTNDLYEKIKDEIPKHIGVYVNCGSEVLSVKKAKRQELGIDEKILKDSFIRSVFREAERYYNINDEDKIRSLERRLSYEERQSKKYYNEYISLQSAVINKLGYEVYDKLK
jgi:hypothetical protein